MEHIIDMILNDSKLIASIALLASAFLGALLDVVKGFMSNGSHPYRSKIFKILLAVIKKMDER